MTITAAVDGSSLGNPGPAGWAWVIDSNTWAAGGWKSATNNIGELTALLRLLTDTNQAGLAGEDLLVLADSQYVINSVTKWIPNWKRRGWKKADGAPVKNLELMQQLDAALQGRKVRFEWVKGHAGHPLNEAADSKARAASEAYGKGRECNSGPGFGSSASSGSQTPPTVQSEAKPPRTDVVTADQALNQWDDVLKEAEQEPVTITRKGFPPLVLMDADLAWQALAALDHQSGASVPDTLF